MNKEKNKKPAKCKGRWELKRYGGGIFWICTKCKVRRKGWTKPAVDHCDM